MIFNRMGADMTRKVSAAKSNISSKLSFLAEDFLVALMAAFLTTGFFTAVVFLAAGLALTVDEVFWVAIVEKDITDRELPHRPANLAPMYDGFDHWHIVSHRNALALTKAVHTGCARVS